ncbi:MAG: oxidoreductase [Planctomycetaceae bacterium]|nr:MAG: oxidoreductase [Planctomycetaceae bacterium]
MVPVFTESPVPLHIDPCYPHDRQRFAIGCIGAGFIMRDCHLVAYQQAGFRTLGIASRRPEQAEEVARLRGIPRVYRDYRELLRDPEIQVVDIAVPPDVQAEVIREIVHHADHIRGILAQKPLGVNFAQAYQIVQWCRQAGVVLVVNQNMRYDQSIRAASSLLRQGVLGQPVLATIEMRAIPHWMPWQQRQGWVTLRIMSIHHLDTFRYWFGNPQRIYVSFRADPRTERKFPHEDGIVLSILEYADGLRASCWDDVWSGPAREGAAADLGIRWRIEGTEGLAQGTIGWHRYPQHCPSTLEFTSTHYGECWFRPQWDQAWFPEAFAGPMAELLMALESGTSPALSGEDNLHTMALVDAGYRAAREQRAVSPQEIFCAFEASDHPSA